MLRQDKPAYPAGESGRPDWPGLTVEVVLYAALFVGAAFMRLYDLGRWPLLTGEAAEALAAWRFLHAQGAAGSASPLLFAGTLASFFAFGAGDAVARLVPALLGTGLVLLPLALRRRLGGWGALSATLVFAFSPTLVYYSRTLAGAVPGLAGVGAVLVAAELASRGRVRAAAYAGAAGLAVGLTSSPWVYSFLLAALLFCGLGWLARRRERPWPGWEENLATGRAILADPRAWAALVVPVAVISTTLLLRPGGLQGTADLLATWLGRLLPGTAGRLWAYAPGVLAFYETGVLLLGLAGLVASLRRGNLWAGFLGLWAGVTVLLAMLSGARDGEPLAFAVLPLSLLSGLAVAETAGRLRAAHKAWTGACLGVFVALLGVWWLQLGAFTRLDIVPVQPLEATLVTLFVAATPVVLAGAGLALYQWFGRAEATWAVAVAGLGLAASLLLHQSVELNYAFARDAREPLVVSPSSVDLRDMAAFLEDWSSRQALDQHELTVAVAADLEPLVTWYLRDFVSVRVLPRSLVGAEAGAILAAGNAGRPDAPGYVATRYRLRTHSDAPLGSNREALAWWLLRERGGRVQAETFDLWVRP